jgi:hypothetical protein
LTAQKQSCGETGNTGDMKSPAGFCKTLASEFDPRYDCKIFYAAVVECIHEGLKNLCSVMGMPGRIWSAVLLN